MKRTQRMRIGMSSMAIFMSLLICQAAFGASFEFTPTAKAAFDKMLAGTASSVSAALKKQHAELQSLQKQDLDYDIRIGALHYKNEENEGKLRQAIREIDAAKIKALEAASASMKKQHESLFKMYEVQKSQLRVVRSYKNKDLAAAMSLQVEITKAAVQAAKKKQSNKDAELKKAKADANAKIKQIRSLLDANQATHSKIKAAKSNISVYKKQFTAEGKVLGSAVRSGDASATSASFVRIIAHQRQILVQKFLIQSYEERIASVIAQADARWRSFR